MVSNLHSEVSFLFDTSQDVLCFISISNNHFLFERYRLDFVFLDESVVDKVGGCPTVQEGLSLDTAIPPTPTK